jgi:hypothetical protein
MGGGGGGARHEGGCVGGRAPSKYTGGFMMSGITRVPQTAPRVHDGSQTLYLNSVALCLITLPS